MPAAVNPQKPQNPPGEDVLAVVRALARLRARIDHEAEIARRSLQARATEPSGMIRVAIYARFSSDLQNDKSVDDQIAFCREVCARNGMTVVLTFEDRAVSASSAKNRPGFIALMRAAAARLFDVVVAEDMDRIFRDQADYHAARKELDFLGITIHTATGKVTKIDGALRALMGEMYLENLALHVRRGLEGVIRDGRHAGGRAYGYSIVPGSPGELVIDSAQAEIVRRIFARFVAGATPRAIAAELNADRIAPPRGASWNASTINGNNARGHGMLLNELYAGRIVWNKVRMVKDPATGKRVSRINAKEQQHGRGFSVEVQGRLAQLTNSALFPSCSEGGGIGGSGESYRLSPHTPNLRYFLRSSA
jgi:site-specific DNA recombinase